MPGDRRYRFVQVDVFSERAFAGNQLAVVHAGTVCPFPAPIHTAAVSVATHTVLDRRPVPAQAR